ncbi:uncharacterized protein N7496_004647 [Penicillium cataractarum]|uniref:Uncharacterized protein n=1 Tax=Penicillium cataractarum TaxID=2100454 RepID=A0A9W9SEP7_9EURO|nr:uncharacterized protein N7496_004647 [Penicillium cataractarum]KAJ5377238.1 hypothetical protein N7496_004647 [Penicillium cataractarum]
MDRSNTGQPPSGSQLPGIPDDQVGTADLDGQDYPWQRQTTSSNPNTQTTHAHPHPHAHPMQMEPHVPTGNQRGYSDFHDSPTSVAPAPPTPQVYDNVPYQTVTPNYAQYPQYPQYPQIPQQAYGNGALPPGTWVFLPYNHGQNQLPPITSLNFAPFSTGAWNAGNPHGPQVPQAMYYGSSPSQMTQPSPFLPPLPGFMSHSYGQQPAHSQQHIDQLAANSPQVQPEEPTEQEEDDDKFKPLCEFSQPCSMSPSPDGLHFRKIVSHLFGRNKASTKLFPESVWVYYCRKHYQRARYRAEQWPFNQCELLLQSLDRMEEWGYVLSFELRLRRREALRTDGQGERPAPSGLLQNGRRHPTAITAPVPDWLQREVGAGNSFNDIRDIVRRIEAYLTSIQKQEDAKRESRTKANAVGNLTKDEKKVAQNAAYRERNSLVRFPDIEILPTFHPDVLEDAKRRSAQKKSGQQAEQADEGGVEGGVKDDVGEEEGEYLSEDGEDLVAEAANQLQRRKKLHLKVGGRISSRGSIKKPAKKEE